MIFTNTDIPDKIFNEEISLRSSVLSIEILIGTRWVTFVKLPEALFAGISEKTDAVEEPIRNTLPLNFIPGNASIVNFTLCPVCTFDILVSSRYATIHKFLLRVRVKTD